MSLSLSILAMMFADTYLLYKGARGLKYDESPASFYESLAYQLIDFKVEKEKGTETRGERRQRELNNVQAILACKQIPHGAKKGNGQRAKQGRCVYCRHHTTLTCSSCAAVPQQPKTVCICNKNKRGCWAKHISIAHMRK